MSATELTALIPSEFSDNARVWVYQSSRAFIVEKEAAEVNEQLDQFSSQWLSHGDKVKGWAKLLFGQFIVVIADEEEVAVSGCSTDSSVKLIKSLEKQYSVNFFDRMMLTFLVKGKAEMLPMGQVQYAIDKGYIDGDTPFFDNTITTKKELMTQWLVPLKGSWLESRVSLPAPKS
jgi:hypothetical protein